MNVIELSALQTPDGGGVVFTFTCNAARQIRCGDLVEQGVANDEHTAAEMLDAAPCDIRYGYVTPGPNAVAAFWRADEIGEKARSNARDRGDGMDVQNACAVGRLSYWVELLLNEGSGGREYVLGQLRSGDEKRVL